MIGGISVAAGLNHGTTSSGGSGGLMNNPFRSSTLARKKTITKKIVPEIKGTLDTEEDHLTSGKQRQSEECYEHESLIHDEFSKKEKILELFSNQDDSDNIGNLENGRITKVEFEKLSVINLSYIIVGLLGIILAIYSYDLEYDELDRNYQPAQVILWVIFLTSLIQISLSLLRTIQMNKFLKARNELPTRIGLFTREDYLPLTLEILVICCCPMPWLYGIRVYYWNSLDNQEIYYHVNDFFCLLILLRLYNIFKIFIDSTIYCSPSALRLCDMYGASKGTWFAIKCIMKKDPFFIVSICLLCTIAIFGYAIRITERPLSRDQDKMFMDFSYYHNSFWVVIVTMTTVGYGDFYPKTIPGRIIIFILCIWGVFIVSMTVVTLTNTLTMSKLELKAFDVILRMRLRKAQSREAGFVLTNVAKYGLLKKKTNVPNSQQEQKNRLFKIRLHLNKLKQITREIKSCQEGTDMFEEVERRLDLFKEDMSDIKKKQNEIYQMLKGLTEGNEGRKSRKNENEEQL